MKDIKINIKMIKFPKPKLYLETTVFNYYFLEDRDRIQDKRDTKELFREIKEGTFEAFYSDVVLVELNRCPQPKRNKLLNLIEKYSINPVQINEEYEDLANLYLMEKVVPPSKRNDAFHLALTTINALDTLVSWNCTHIVRFKTRKMINLINEANGYKEIDVNTPKEVIENVS